MTHGGRGFVEKGEKMIRISHMDIRLQTDDGEILLHFSPAQPRGYKELTKAISSFEDMRKRAVELAKGDKALAGAFIIDGEMKSLQELKEAIRIALLPKEWEKLEPIMDYIDIEAMLEIATSILNAYTMYYNRRLTDGMEP